MADQGGGQEVENSMHYGEIGEMAGRAGGSQEMENSMHYGEIGEMAGRPGVGSGYGEFDVLWRNRRNGLADQGGSGNGEFDAFWRNR